MVRRKSNHIVHYCCIFITGRKTTDNGGLISETSTPDNPKVLPDVTVQSYSGKQLVKTWWLLKQQGVPFERISNNYLREDVIRHENLQNYLNELHAGIRSDGYLLLEGASWFIPMGWVSEIRCLKYASYLFKAKRGLAGLKAFKYVTQFGIKTYRELKAVSPLGSEVHHLIEKRFASLFGQAEKDMQAIVLTQEEHQALTNAWRAEIGYEGSNAAITTLNATQAQVEDAARRIYADYPEILKALGL